MARGADRSASSAWGRHPFDPTLRIGDAERNEVADALSQHFSEGRLDQVEMKERVDRAMSAKTGADLDGILSDLPPLPGPPPPPPPPRSRSAALCLVLGVVFLAIMAGPAHFGAWMWFPRVPWLLFGLVAFVLWRRSRRRRWWSRPTS